MRPKIKEKKHEQQNKGKTSKREYAKQTLAKLENETPGCKQRIFSAIERGTPDGWPVKIDNPRLYNKDAR